MSKYTVGFLFAVAGPLLHRRAAVKAREHIFILFDKNMFLKKYIYKLICGLDGAHGSVVYKSHAYETTPEVFAVKPEVLPPNWKTGNFSPVVVGVVYLANGRNIQNLLEIQRRKKVR